MKDIAWMDRYWKEVLEVSTWKYDIKGSVSLRYYVYIQKLTWVLNLLQQFKIKYVKKVFFDNRIFSFLNCEGKCIRTSLAKDETWLCDDVCQNWTVPCNGQCHNDLESIDCNGECHSIHTVYQCGDKCMSKKLPCDGTCPGNNSANFGLISMTGLCSKNQTVKPLFLHVALTGLRYVVIY